MNLEMTTYEEYQKINDDISKSDFYRIVELEITPDEITKYARKLARTLNPGLETPEKIGAIENDAHMIAKIEAALSELPEYRHKIDNAVWMAKQAYAILGKKVAGVNYTSRIPDRTHIPEISSCQNGSCAKTRPYQKICND